jgi:hypothetical protein
MKKYRRTKAELHAFFVLRLKVLLSLKWNLTALGNRSCEIIVNIIRKANIENSGLIGYKTFTLKDKQYRKTH